MMQKRHPFEWRYLMTKLSFQLLKEIARWTWCAWSAGRYLLETLLVQYFSLKCLASKAMAGWCFAQVILCLWYRCGQKDTSRVSRICSDVLSFRLRSTKLGMNMGLPKGFHMTPWNPTSASTRPQQRSKDWKNGPSKSGAGAKAIWPLKVNYGPKVA